MIQGADGASPSNSCRSFVFSRNDEPGLPLAHDSGGVYFFPMHPVVNIEDPVGKVVGKRANISERNYIDYALAMQKSLRGFSQPRFPKGVFRFKSHEEADQWLMDHLTRKQAS